MPEGGETFTLTWSGVSDDSDFGRGAHGVDAGVSVAGVRALVGRLDVVQDQAAVGGRLDVSTVRTHRHAVPAVEDETGS